MKSISRNFLILFYLLFFSSQLFFAQENPTEWPYGGVPDTNQRELRIFHPEIKKEVVIGGITKIPLNFNNPANFSAGRFYNDAYFAGAFFDSVSFFGTNFDSAANFIAARFNKQTVFEYSQFHSYAIFNYTHFKNMASFSDVYFKKSANFSAGRFAGLTYFARVRFDSLTYFQFARFKDRVYFEQAKFGGLVYFGNTQFDTLADFSGAQFLSGTNFDGTVFKGIINLAAATFKSDLDLRRAKFDSVETIYIDHNTTFPTGKLHLYWDEFKAKNKLRIQLSNYPANLQIVKREHYQRIETFYHRMRDNYLFQGNKTSADAVMYELGWQREEILKEFWWKLYGWFFGWGYQPWRFLVFVVLPIILLFAGFWYKYFYHIVAILVWEKMPDSMISEISKSKYREETTLFKKLKHRRFSHSKFSTDNISYIARLWQVIFFSSSVLLGIRFKKDWIESKNQAFMYVITFEWLLGIGLFVAFALLVKSARFDFVKSLLGF